MVPPVSTPVVVTIAAPPAPARKPLVPATPIVVKPAASPAPMTGARRPADRPMTSPPPTVAKPMKTNRLFLAIFLRVSICSSSFQFSLLADSCISNASVTRFSNRQISSHSMAKWSPTLSNSCLERESYIESAMRMRKRSHKIVQRISMSIF
jgi:hypothetical protein